MRNQSRESGFTLIELMIVMSIIAVLAASVIPIAKVYKEKALLARAQQGARCLQSSLVGLDSLPAAERALTIHSLGGLSAEFHEAVASLGCRLGPTVADPRTEAVLEPDDCRVLICQDGPVVREENCSSFDETSLAPDEAQCGILQICRIPGVPKNLIQVTDSTIETLAAH